MNNLKEMLCQSIGIYYIDRDYAARAFVYILELYPKELISKIIKAQNNMRIEIKDGSTITFVRTTESARGYCFSKIITQPGIDKETINTIIAPALKHYNRQIMVFDF